MTRKIGMNYFLTRSAIARWGACLILGDILVAGNRHHLGVVLTDFMVGPFGSDAKAVLGLNRW